MGVLDAFTATWSNARTTFGEGTPQTGESFDASGPLGQLQSDLSAAAPGSRWTGSASSAYDAVNTEHRRVIGELGSLDQRMRTQIDRSAQVVSAGRADLDAVHKWVLDAANAVPRNAAGERMLLPIVQKGLGEVAQIVARSNGEMNAIGAGIRRLDAEYRALGDQKLGRGDPNADGNGKDGDKLEEPHNPYEKALRADQLRQIVESGKSWDVNSDGVPEARSLDLDRLLHHEEMHSRQWADKGHFGMLWAVTTDADGIEEEGGLGDGGYK
jgi:hypothetical protein